MRKLAVLALMATLVCFETACAPLEVTARNVLTASKTAILDVSAGHPECKLGMTAPTVCKVLNDAVAAHNTAVSALTAYCEGTPAPGVQSYDNGGVCVPIKTASDALASALKNLAPLIKDLTEFK